MGHSPVTPTRRELVLVLALLLSILYYSNSSIHSSLVPAPVSPPLYTPSEFLNTLEEKDPRIYQPRLTWGNNEVPQTKVLANVPGWSIIDRLYIFKGVLYVVSDDPSSVPDVENMYSKGLEIFPGKEAEDSRLPGDEDIRIISTAEARKLFRNSFFVNDHPQLLDAFRWRDPTDMNELVLRSSFPEVTMEFRDDWDDRIKMGSSFVFERVVLADRSAAMRAYITSATSARPPSPSDSPAA
ncbi:hypothetical protein MSAN_01827000 [Mycena sanguinolenta]|uniref:Uncharacterized protein n=1 Tax=Mycena sanguinolenta TaxID=230812 RepID=A0A8H6XT99_9AGAR|nr:hypothetical protein MSAN_01827000 [Mycena sanguinolenta]